MAHKPIQPNEPDPEEDDCGVAENVNANVPQQLPVFARTQKLKSESLLLDRLPTAR